MQVIANQDLKDAAIDLDDHYFENCTLIGCTLVFSGKDFRMQDCRMVDCHLRLGGKAARMIQLLAQLLEEPETQQTIESSLVH